MARPGVELDKCSKCGGHATTIRVRCEEHSLEREIEELRHFLAHSLLRLSKCETKCGVCFYCHAMEALRRDSKSPP